MDKTTAKELIARYQMTPHPEGGHFLEYYRSHKMVSDSKVASTAIYFLLEKGEKSHFHKISSDELWHFYLGDSLEILEFDEKGSLVRTILGRNFEQGEVLTHVVSAGRWFASRPLEKSSFSFVGCTVSPGFEFSDFTLGSKEILTDLYPDHKSLIEELTLT